MAEQEQRFFFSFRDIKIWKDTPPKKKKLKTVSCSLDDTHKRVLSFWSAALYLRQDFSAHRIELAST